MTSILKRRPSILITLFAAATVAAGTARAADYYVSTAGNDGASGSSSAPWRTLQKAANTVRAGDVVHVTPGTYAGFQITTDGTAASPIKFLAAAGALVNTQNASTTDNINLEGASYVTIDGFTVEDAPRVGIRAVQCSGAVISNNTVRRSGLTGILSGWTPGIVIENNVVSASTGEHGIYVSNSNTASDNPVIRGNEVFGNAKNGIQLNGDCAAGGDGVIEGALVEANIVHDNNWKGFSIISTQASVFQNNIVYDNGISAGAGGLHLADEPGCGKPSSNNLVVNNTFVEPRIACIRLSNGSTACVIFNNVCISPSTSRLIVDESGGNLIDGASNINRTAATGLFVNDASRDLHLANGSAAIDAGVPNYQGRPAPPVDADGLGRPGGLRHDAGAFEVGGEQGVDVTPPSVVVTAPAGNSTVSAATSVTATASDNVMVASVEFLVDNVAIGLPDVAAPYSIPLDPSAYPTGFYTLTARARDDAGNVAVSAPVSVFLQNGSTQSGIPATHPRLTLVNGRLEQLRRDACYDDNGNVIANCTPTHFADTFFNFVDNSPGKAEAWQFALAYMITGQQSYATQAITAIDEMVACDWQCPANSHKHFLYIRDYMREVALVYDWLHNQLSAQQRSAWVNYMNKMMFLVWNDTPEANAIYDTRDWNTSNAKNNFFHNYILATTYVALATYGENPGSFTHNGTTYEWSAYMLSRDLSSDRYTDMWEFLLAKLREQCFPVLDSNGRGGGWIEGENYGRASKRHLFEALLLLKQTAGIDYFNDPAHPFARESVRYQYHTVQPGGRSLYSGGDAAQDPINHVNPYDRHMMLLLADGLRGTLEGQYAQYFCRRVVPEMNGISVMIPVDFLLYDASLPERSFAERPTAYIAEGIDWVNSRSSWDSDAISVTFTSTDCLQGHQHRDQNHFVIYAGGAGQTEDGWLLTDTQIFSSGLPRTSNLHNTLMVNNTSQRFGSGTGNMAKYESQATYTYAVGDAAGAYYTNPGDYGEGDARMLDVFQRELVHIMPGYVVVFDRISTANGFESAEIKSMFHYPYTQPVVSGGVYSTTVDENRMFQKVLLPAAPAIAWVDEEALDAGERQQTWRMELKDSVTRPSYQFLNVFYATKATTAAMPATARVNSQDGQMVGAVIKDPVQEHVVMFSADPSGAAPVGNIIYEVGLDLRSRQHLFDLVPGLGYAIELARRADGYTVTVRDGGPHVASESGSLVFSLEDILEPSAPVAAR